MEKCRGQIAVVRKLNIRETEDYNSFFLQFWHDEWNAVSNGINPCSIDLLQEDPPMGSEYLLLHLR